MVKNMSKNVQWCFLVIFLSLNFIYCSNFVGFYLKINLDDDDISCLTKNKNLTISDKTFNYKGIKIIKRTELNIKSKNLNIIFLWNNYEKTNLTLSQKEGRIFFEKTVNTYLKENNCINNKKISCHFDLQVNSDLHDLNFCDEKIMNTSM